MPKVPFWIFLLLAILYISAVRIDIMDIDASQYAEISREMNQWGSYLQLYDHGIDYLDKPPFLFWVSSLGIKFFGPTNFGYKIFSILFAIWAVYATYRLAKILYNERVGQIAALVIGTCQGMFLMTNDVRTDTILMSCVVTGIWMLREFEISRKRKYLFFGGAAIAFGMMTKGPIALMVPAFCFGTDWLLKRQLGKFFSKDNLLLLLVIGVFLIPMSIGLYQQFDMHPEKVVNDVRNVSGLRFFYWSQSFGRITGESPWNNGAGFDFLLSNMLWSYLPWIFIFLVALVINVKDVIKQRFRLLPGQEWITTGGFILAYMALGSSHYQLPHYIFVVFPLAAIITAKFLADILEEGKYPRIFKILNPLQIGISFLLWVAILLMFIIVFPLGIAGIVLWVLLFVGLVVLAIKVKGKKKMLWLSVASIMLVNVFLTHYFYYDLLEYQLGSQLGHYIKDNRIPPEKVYIYKIDDQLVNIHYYADHTIGYNSDSVKPDYYLVTDNTGLSWLNERNVSYNILKKGPFFKVSELTPEFLNYKTRDKAVKRYYFVRFN